MHCTGRDTWPRKGQSVTPTIKSMKKSPTTCPLRPREHHQSRTARLKTTPLEPLDKITATGLTAWTRSRQIARMDFTTREAPLTETRCWTESPALTFPGFRPPFRSRSPGGPTRGTRLTLNMRSHPVIDLSIPKANQWKNNCRFSRSRSSCALQSTRCQW